MKIIAVLLTAILATFTACAPQPPANNQPGGGKCDVPAAYEEGEPVAQFADGKYLYDVFVELWDDECNSVPVADELANDTEGKKPLHVSVTGNITDKNGVSQEADYMGGSRRDKDADAPYHLRADVSPRQAPHSMSVLASVNRAARNMVHEALDGGGFLHCHINRDNQKIQIARGSRDRPQHTVALEFGRGAVNCHFFVGTT